MASMSSRWSLLAACVLVLGTACHRSPQKIIGVVPKATSHLFFVSVHAGVDQAARDFNVNAIWNGPTDETAFPRQIQIVHAFLARHLDPPAIPPTDERRL